jgi:TolB-like protein/DNA-binding winged helix-turn-helix (wHTH) protein/cytochrome c-type biogenesis protein CcmH/NrfG
MITRDAESLGQKRPRRLQFDRYVMDLDRGCVLIDGSEIALRPKTFAVLRHLIENSGRLVSKDELFAAVWPNTATTDDTLVQSIGELRRALRDDGSRLIKTIPRRGYRFEPPVSAIGPVDWPEADSAPKTPHDVPQSSESVIRARPWHPFAWAQTGRRGLFATFALVISVAGAALLIAVSDWTFPGHPRRGDQSNRVEASAKPVIAILPFLNQSDDPAREYFADGLTQDIINALGRFSALTVMSWNAVRPYKDKPSSPENIRRGLAARYLVEGGVRQVGDRLRVTAELVDTTQGQVLWSSRFEEPLTNVFILQDNITAQIASVLALRVTQLEQRRVFAKPTASLEAYDYVLRARPALQQPTRTNVVEARTLLRRAVELDPNYAAAYAALAQTYHTTTSMGWAESPLALLDRAEELATKALSLDPSEVRARVILGHIYIFHQRYKQAETEIERAISTNPNDAQGLAGRGNILMWLGQTDAAIEALEQAQRIDPDLPAFDRFALSLAYYLKQRYDAAIEQAELSLRENAGANFSRIVLAAAYGERNRTEDAARVVSWIRRTDPTFDRKEFGTKFLNSVDLDHLRDGLRKAGL